MLDTNTLCARVTTPARAKSRSLYMTFQSRKWAEDLRKSGKADKTTTRVLTDGLLALLDYYDRNKRLKTAEKEYLEHEMARIEGQQTVKVQLSLSDAHWDIVTRLANSLSVCPSKLVRVVSHVAMERVHEELSGR